MSSLLNGYLMTSYIRKYAPLSLSLSLCLFLSQIQMGSIAKALGIT